MRTTIQWEQEYIADFESDGPVLEVQDECTTFCASIPDGMTVDDMLREYARTYDHNGVPGSVTVRWGKYECGEREWSDSVDSGEYTFIDKRLAYADFRTPARSLLPNPYQLGPRAHDGRQSDPNATNRLSAAELVSGVATGNPTIRRGTE